MGLRKIWRFLGGTAQRFFVVDGLFLASGLAFDLLISCIPFLFLVASGLGFFLFENDRSMVWLQDLLQNLLPATRQAFTENLSMMIANRNHFGLIGFLFFFLFASSMFGSVRLVLDRIYELKQERHFLFYLIDGRNLKNTLKSEVVKMWSCYPNDYGLQTFDLKYLWVKKTPGLP